MEGPGSLPVEISATGQTTYNNGLATARDNVAIHFGDTDIYSDFAQYDSAKRTVFLQGHVRIYRGVTLYMGEKATYNLDTKAINADEMRSGTYPYLLSGKTVTSDSDEEYTIKNGSFTTDDSSQPDFHLNAQSVRIYENDRIIFKNVTFYVGKTPIFWWPYLYQSLDRSFSYSIVPAYLSSWGPSLLGEITFPIGEKIVEHVETRLSQPPRHRARVRFRNSLWEGEQGRRENHLLLSAGSESQFESHLPAPQWYTRPAVTVFSIQDRTHITDDLEATVEMTKLSDIFLLQDFFPTEFRVNPQPDNVVALTQTNPFYTLTAYSRFQLNTFFETTERLPEIALDIKRHGLFGGPIFYEGETSAGQSTPGFSGRVDLRGLRCFSDRFFPPTDLSEHLFRVAFARAEGRIPRDLLQRDATALARLSSPTLPIRSRPNFRCRIRRPGFQTRRLARFFARFSTLASRVRSSSRGNGTTCRIARWDSMVCVTSFSRSVNFSYVSSPNIDPTTILQFDRVQASTKLNPIDFPQYTSIDSIDNWTVARVGVRNRLQTRRDDFTVSWLELETFFDVNLTILSTARITRTSSID